MQERSHGGNLQIALGTRSIQKVKFSPQAGQSERIPRLISRSPGLAHSRGSPSAKAARARLI